MPEGVEHRHGVRQAGRRRTLQAHDDDPQHEHPAEAPVTLVHSKRAETRSRGRSGRS
ncbi:hypothetical protein CURTO8I2_70226 [Curtobacterium sp. 8I-2]|nr:hypothetical protein CURTO8I2_70226 [Curtobacterium sp. 8I-2]